jgi:hypothetical protein
MLVRLVEFSLVQRVLVSVLPPSIVIFPPLVKPA